MQIATRMSDQLTRYLDLATAEIKVTAGNMANIDTPGYRALGMDFNAEMRTALNDVDQGNGSRAVHVMDVDGLVARPDGNDVSVDQESLNLAQAQLKFKTGVVLLRSEFQRVLDAIHADGK